jgi:hypothetical protein
MPATTVRMLQLKLSSAAEGSKRKDQKPSCACTVHYYVNMKGRY